MTTLVLLRMPTELFPPTPAIHPTLTLRHGNHITHTLIPARDWRGSIAKTSSTLTPMRGWRSFTVEKARKPIVPTLASAVDLLRSIMKLEDLFALNAKLSSLLQAVLNM
jgi:hypothetical protein